MNLAKSRIKGNCSKCFWGTFLYIFILILLLFVIAFVIIPVVFKYSVGIQRDLIFPAWIITPKNYSDIESFGIKGVKNFYVDVENGSNVTLGVWQILPQEILSDVIENQDYNYEGVLTNGNYSILLYLHGNGGDRASALELYNILRKQFHVFAVDYRGYGDSSRAEMTRTGIVDDMVQLYKWIRRRTKSNIFVWGHSLGTGVGIQLVANLDKVNISTNGLILETPFTSVIDVMMKHPLVRIYSYLPWFRATIIDPIIANDFNFDNEKYIGNVDSPIMILHAKDDTVIPYEQATQLFSTAVDNRNATYQGNVTYHLFEALGYDHMWIFEAPELPNYIKIFKEECEKFGMNEKRENGTISMF